MRVDCRGNATLLVWGHHELAFSARTSQVRCPIFDNEGRVLKIVRTEKRAGSARLPEGAAYFLRRYWTGGGYPKHTLFRLPDLKEVARVSRDTTETDIQRLPVPRGIKEFLADDLFGEVRWEAYEEGIIR